MVLSILLLTLTGILIALVVVFLCYIKWIHQYWKRRNMPYLPPTFPMGHVIVSRNPDPIGIQMKKVYDRVSNKGRKHCGIYFFLRPTYMPLDLDLIKNIMTRDFQYFTDRGTYYNERDDPLSAHLFSIGGIKWRNLRTKLTPTFTSGKMRQMFQTLMACEVPLRRAMNVCYHKKEAADIKDILARFTINSISSCAFGIESDCFEDDDSLFRKYGKKTFEVPPLRSLILMFAINYPNVARQLGLLSTERDVSQFFLKVVEDVVTYRKQTGTTRNDFFQLLLDIKIDGDNKGDGTSLTMDEMAAQCFVFFIAGFETSSTTSTFLLYELAKNQQIQDRVRQEIDEVLERHHGQVTYDALNEMTYMNQVIDETLRKYPPLPFLTRECVKDYAVPGTDAVLEEGTLVLIPVLGLHTDSQYYPEPDKFDPDRFDDSHKLGRHPYAHLAFGEGPRICIGMRFGLMQAKVGITSLIRNYKFSVNGRTKEPFTFLATTFIPTVEGDIWLDIDKVTKC